jgi:hypothetical protein
MLTLPAACSAAILAFAPLFSKSAWATAETLLVGALLAPAQRTVTAALRVTGLSNEEQFQRYHRLLNRVRWSPLQAARVLLEQLLRRFVPTGVVHVVLDDTLERRRGKKIAAKGVYRDAVRSSGSHFVKATGLRWMCLMLLAELPFSRRRWALPLLTLLAPSERYDAERGRSHMTLIEKGRSALLLLARWLPDRQIVCVADSSFLALKFLESVRTAVTVITRLRLDAALYEPAAERRSGQTGRPRLKGARLPTLQQLLSDTTQCWQSLRLTRWYQQEDRHVEVLSATAVWYHTGMPVVPLRWVLVRDPQKRFPAQAFLSTDLSLTATQILEYYVERWQVEVTFEETRQHLGIETQRQWSETAIKRTTPIIMALYSLVTLIAAQLHQTQQLTMRTSAWYVKEQITFSDALAAVRRILWQSQSFSMSDTQQRPVNISQRFYRHVIDMLYYAA